MRPTSIAAGSVVLIAAGALLASKKAARVSGELEAWNADRVAQGNRSAAAGNAMVTALPRRPSVNTRSGVRVSAEWLGDAVPPGVFVAAEPDYPFLPPFPTNLPEPTGSGLEAISREAIDALFEEAGRTLANGYEVLAVLTAAQFDVVRQSGVPREAVEVTLAADDRVVLPCGESEIAIEVQGDPEEGTIEAKFYFRADRESERETLQVEVWSGQTVVLGRMRDDASSPVAIQLDLLDLSDVLAFAEDDPFATRP